MIPLATINPAWTTADDIEAEAAFIAYRILAMGGALSDVQDTLGDLWSMLPALREVLA